MCFVGKLGELVLRTMLKIDCGVVNVLEMLGCFSDWPARCMVNHHSLRIGLNPFMKSLWMKIRIFCQLAYPSFPAY